VLAAALNSRVWPQECALLVLRMRRPIIGQPLGSLLQQRRFQVLAAKVRSWLQPAVRTAQHTACHKMMHIS
jgi:hypothetical protein